MRDRTRTGTRRGSSSACPAEPPAQYARFARQGCRDSGGRPGPALILEGRACPPVKGKPSNGSTQGFVLREFILQYVTGVTTDARYHDRTIQDRTGRFEPGGELNSVHEQAFTKPRSRILLHEDTDTLTSTKRPHEDLFANRSRTEILEQSFSHSRHQSGCP